MKTPPEDAPSSRSSRGRLLALLFGSALALWWCTGWLAVRSVALRARPPRPEPLPARYEGAVGEQRLATPAGESFGTWWFDGDPGRAVILLLHAVGCSRTTMLPQALEFQARGHAVLAPTLHAHGDASGAINDFGWTARLQVPVCLDRIEDLAPGRPVIVCGVSLGAATAIFAAQTVQRRVAGYVLEAPFRDLGSATRNRLGMSLHGALVPVAYWAMRAAAPVYFDERAIDPLAAIEGMPRDLPALLLVGAHDRHVTPAEVRDLARAHGSKATFTVVPAAAHGSLSGENPRAYWSAVEAFVAGVEAQAAAASPSDRAPGAASRARAGRLPTGR